MAKWIVELEPGVYLAPWSGDPGRTLQIANAERFKSKRAAEGALTDARALKAFKQARCVNREKPNPAHSAPMNEG